MVDLLGVGVQAAEGRHRSVEGVVREVLREAILMQPGTARAQNIRVFVAITTGSWLQYAVPHRHHAKDNTIQQDTN